MMKWAMMERGMVVKTVLRFAYSLLSPLLPASLLTGLEKSYFWRYGERELRLVPCLCRPDEDAMDIGGSQGCYTLFMRKHARRVHTFEPVPSMADRLAGKFGDSICLHRLALSSVNGTSRLLIPSVEGKTVTALSSLSPQPGMTGTRLEVETKRLDDIGLDRVGFIKIDVEGHEEAVLAGAAETIRRCRPRLLIEIEERHSPGGLGRISRLLAERGYRGFYFLDNTLHPADGFAADRLQRPEDVKASQAGPFHRRTATYVNNFVFLPEEDIPHVMARLG